MGKGDKRSRRGKIWKGSYGNTRRRKKKHKPLFIPKPKVKKKVMPVEEAVSEVTPLIESAVVAQTETATARPKKAPDKKAKTEGEKKSTAKKETKKKAPSKEKK